MDNGNPIPDDDHVLRHITWSRLIKDSDGETVIGVFPQAFELRDIDGELETYLSVNWIEYFADTPTKNIELTVQSVRSGKPVGAKSAFCLAKVSDIKNACLAHAIRPRIYYQKNSSTNPSHSAISHTTNKAELLVSLRDAFNPNQLIHNSSIP